MAYNIIFTFRSVNYMKREPLWNKREIMAYRNIYHKIEDGIVFLISFCNTDML